jgi:hypothetical protein
MKSRLPFRPYRRDVSRRPSRLTVALQEDVLTRIELLRLLRQAGYRAWTVAGYGGAADRRALKIKIRCRDRRGAVRLASRIERVPGVAVASVDGTPEL